MPYMHQNQRIAALAAQLPLQRRQLALQTTKLTQALSNSLSSPTTLLVAAASGGLLGWHWFRPQPHCGKNSYADNQLSGKPAPNDTEANDRAAKPATKGTIAAVTALLRQSGSAAVMAYLARSLA